MSEVPKTEFKNKNFFNKNFDFNIKKPIISLLYFKLIFSLILNF